jgi:ribosomal protection tetracycline resistance protein
MPILNLGFLAHVDAGKTSLTERVLFETATIAAAGDVDSGTTQTDTLELERQRGITIQSAVVSFHTGDLKVNLIDTPGHADFIAEVERALSALDAVVIVISAVEGVQPQTRKLVRVVRDLGLPMLIFCNKIDRLGARHESLIEEIEGKLGLAVLPMTRPLDAGSRAARVASIDYDDPDAALRLVDLLTRNNDDLLRNWIENGERLSRRTIRKALRNQVRRGLITPAYFGSAITGAGVDALIRGIADLLPRAPQAEADGIDGRVFKIQRGPTGEKLVYVRLRSGQVQTRQRIAGHTCSAADDEGWSSRVTGIDRFVDGSAIPDARACSGEIVRLHGLREARIGDVIGAECATNEDVQRFAPPTLESVVRPIRPEQVTALYAALVQLAEQDPLIGVQRDERTAEISLRLFGEVQKEIVTSMLANDYGIEVEFESSRIICIERPIGTGWTLETMGWENPFVAAVGIRVEPGPAGSGVTFRRPSGALPLAFYVAIEETVYKTLREGLLGWNVEQILVTVTETAYASPVTVAGDFRNLTPLVLMDALRQAGTRVYEPIQGFEVQVPTATVGPTLSALVSLRAIPQQTTELGGETTISGTIPAATIHDFENRLPGISGGNGIISSEFSGYQPVTGAPPTRDRTDFNPLDRKYYLAQVSQH